MSTINTDGPVVVASFRLGDIVSGVSSSLVDCANDIVKGSKVLVKLQIAWDDNDLGLSKSFWFVALI